MNTTSYMDKQIMDLSQGSSSPQTKDFIDLITHNNHTTTLHTYHHHHSRDEQEEEEEDEDQSLSHGGAGNGISNNDEILASYDFQPIRPVAGPASSSSSQPASFDLAGSSRAWNSGDSKPKTASPIRNYSSLDSLAPAKFVLEKDQSAFDSAIIDEIDKTMKKHADNLMHALEGVSARLTQLETRTRHLESSVDDLKVSVGNNHGTTDGKMRQLENILREVQSGVQVMKDKQGVVEAQLQLAKLQVSKADHHQETQAQTTAAPVDSVLTSAASAPQPPHQQLPPPVNHAPPHAPFSPPNAPPQPAPQHSLPPPVQLPSQFPQTQIPPAPQRDPYFHTPGQTQESPNLQYQMPPSQPQLPPPVLPPHQQFQPTPQPQYSQPPPPPPQPPQQHPSLAPVIPSQLQPQLSHHLEEPSYVPPQTYPPPNLRQPPSQPPSGPPPPQQYYGGPPSQAYDQPPPSSRPSSGFPSGYGPPSGLNEPYHYSGSASQYGNLSGMKPQQLSSPTASQGSSGGYPQLPTARVLPHASPAASAVGGGSGSSGSVNRVPVDDVIDKVTTMGFPRDLVRATVRKLTENGQSVDLNIVLDKVMNEGDGQPPRGWFGR